MEQVEEIGVGVGRIHKGWGLSRDRAWSRESIQGLELGEYIGVGVGRVYRGWSRESNMGWSRESIQKI